jgi:class 3 adenylate cyclase
MLNGFLTRSVERREATVLFSGIRGFTSFSEKMGPAEVVDFLNQYFSRMNRLLVQYKGTPANLTADAGMCFWEHTSKKKDDATRAAVAALEMIHAVEDLRGVLVLPGGAKFEIEIGINTGLMVVGTVGSHDGSRRTVIGDSVELGSHLKSLNKYYGTKIIISDSTFDTIQDTVFCRQLDTIHIEGEPRTVTIYEPMGLRHSDHERRRMERRGPLTSKKRTDKTLVPARYGEKRRGERRMGAERLMVKPEQEEITAMYEHALELFRKGELDDAGMGFEHVLSLSPTDGPSRLMKGRLVRQGTECAGAQSC